MILTEHERRLVRDALAAIADAVSYADGAADDDLRIDTEEMRATIAERVQSWQEAHDELAAAAEIEVTDPRMRHDDDALNEAGIRLTPDQVHDIAENPSKYRTLGDVKREVQP